MPELTQLERAYFTRKLGSGAATRPFNDIKKAYLLGQVQNSGGREELSALEKKWLQKIVAASGQTPAKYISDLWKQAVLSISGTPTKYINQNKKTFFATAP